MSGEKSPRALRRLLPRALMAGFIFLVGLELTLQAAHSWAVRLDLRQSLADPGAPVILCLGDSHTYGAGVSADDAYPARLEQLLRERGLRASVVNLGAPGMNTSEIRRRLPAWLSSYQPAAVIVLAGVNNGWNRRDQSWSDLEDGLPVSWSVRARDFLSSRVRLARAAIVLVHRLDWTRPEEERSRDRFGRLVLHERKESWQVESAQATYDRAGRDLAAIIALVRAQGAVPVLMTYVTDPVATFETPNRLLRETAARARTILADNDRALQPFFMLDEHTMDKAKRAELFFPDMHPRGPGYQKIAENVMKSLEQAGVTALLSADP